MRNVWGLQWCTRSISTPGSLTAKQILKENTICSINNLTLFPPLRWAKQLYNHMPSNHRQPRPLLFIEETVKFTVTCCVCINYKKEGDIASFNLLCIEVKWTHTVLFQHFVSILLKNDCFFHSVWAFFRQSVMNAYLRMLLLNLL